MVKHTRTIRQLLPMNCLSVFHNFVGLALKGLGSGPMFQQEDKLCSCPARFKVYRYLFKVRKQNPGIIS